MVTLHWRRLQDLDCSSRSLIFTALIRFHCAIVAKAAAFALFEPACDGDGNGRVDDGGENGGAGGGGGGGGGEHSARTGET